MTENENQMPMNIEGGRAAGADGESKAPRRPARRRSSQTAGAAPQDKPARAPRKKAAQEKQDAQAGQEMKARPPRRRSGDG